MGMDLALGGLVLIMAIRGWLKGFVLQAIRLGGLVSCVYAADPVRDLAKPQILPYLPTIGPELIDRGLWWTSAVLSYVVLVGLASLAVKVYRRQPLGLEERNRNDQLGGALLGIAKGGILAAFLTAGIQEYALGHLKSISWAAEQVESSQALAWNTKYHPSARIWSAPPVQLFVNHVKKRGLNGAPKKKAESEAKEAEPVQTASRTPKLHWWSWNGSPLDGTDLDPEVAKAIESIQDELRKAQGPNN